MIIAGLHFSETSQHPVLSRRRVLKFSTGDAVSCLAYSSYLYSRNVSQARALLGIRSKVQVIWKEAGTFNAERVRNVLSRVGTMVYAEQLRGLY